jgi:2-polyprenyl-6-methoxyphenol hydroxylase-like FAD-dependent oxidoreductase
LPLSAAGIGGLTAAVALARKGLAAEVYEQAPAAELDPSAIHLDARCTGVENGNRAVTAPRLHSVRGITPAGSVPLSVDGTETWGRGAHFGLGPTSGERIS